MPCPLPISVSIQITFPGIYRSIFTFRQHQSFYHDIVSTGLPCKRTHNVSSFLFHYPKLPHCPGIWLFQHQEQKKISSGLPMWMVASATFLLNKYSTCQARRKSQFPLVDGERLTIASHKRATLPFLPLHRHSH